MPRTLFQFHRTFQMWQYVVSHGQLLLRSPKTTEEVTQVDVLFKDVSEIHMRTSIDDLVIRELDPTEIPGFIWSPNIGNRVVYELTGNNHLEGYVIAGSACYVESAGDYWETSQLIE